MDMKQYQHRFDCQQYLQLTYNLTHHTDELRNLSTSSKKVRNLPASSHEVEFMLGVRVLNEINARQILPIGKAFVDTLLLFRTVIAVEGVGDRQLPALAQLRVQLPLPALPVRLCDVTEQQTRLLAG